MNIISMLIIISLQIKIVHLYEMVRWLVWNSLQFGHFLSLSSYFLLTKNIKFLIFLSTPLSLYFIYIPHLRLILQVSFLVSLRLLMKTKFNAFDSSVPALQGPATRGQASLGLSANTHGLLGLFYLASCIYAKKHDFNSLIVFFKRIRKQ